MRTTPQQDRILIALTRDHLPRTVENLAVETGIPKASIRRVLSELRAQISFRPLDEIRPWLALRRLSSNSL